MEEKEKARKIFKKKMGFKSLACIISCGGLDHWIVETKKIQRFYSKYVWIVIWNRYLKFLPSYYDC